jgi:dihydroorotate dehydrogenase
LIYFRKKLPHEIALIGVGGIMSADDAVERINAGCQLIQIYSGMIFNGPWLPKAIVNRL